MWIHPGPLVLRTDSLNPAPPTPDRDRTVSRRSKPSSRTALIGEQPNPWDLLQPQDAMSRHRGAKPCRRCELLGRISLLSPAYLLSVERRPFHTEPPDSVPPPDYGGRLESRQTKDGISPLAPPPPRGRVQSLPSILRIVCPKSLSSCSKGARGLSV